MSEFCNKLANALNVCVGQGLLWGGTCKGEI